jgi:mRNA interferase MazF
VARLVPSAGDIVWVELDPIKGTEQAGRRPALVITPLDYNRESTRVVVCPVTSTKRTWPFDVPLPSTLKTVGYVLVDQVRSIDRAERVFRRIEPAPRSVLDEVLDRLSLLVGR